MKLAPDLNDGNILPRRWSGGHFCCTSAFCAVRPASKVCIARTCRLADYYSVIAGTVSSLDNNTGDAARKDELMAIGNPDLTPAPPWQPSDLPTLRAAYSDRTAALMAYLAAFAYDPPIETQPPTIPSEILNAGFQRITSFHNGYTDGWAYILEGKEIIVLAFRGTVSQKNWHTNFNAALIHTKYRRKFTCARGVLSGIFEPVRWNQGYQDKDHRGQARNPGTDTNLYYRTFAWWSACANLGRSARE